LVKPAVELTADWTVQRQDAFLVGGKIIDARTGKPPVNGFVGLASCRAFGAGLGVLVSGSGYDPSTGAFLLQNVTPGPYLLRAQMQPPSALGTLTAPEESEAAEVTIEVRKGDLNGLTLTLTKGVVLAGRVTVDGPTMPSPAEISR